MDLLWHVAALVIDVVTTHLFAPVDRASVAILVMGEAGLAEVILGNEAPRTLRCLVHSPAVSPLSMPPWQRTHRGTRVLPRLYTSTVAVAKRCPGLTSSDRACAIAADSAVLVCFAPIIEGLRRLVEGEKLGVEDILVLVEVEPSACHPCMRGAGPGYH